MGNSLRKEVLVPGCREFIIDEKAPKVNLLANMTQFFRSLELSIPHFHQKDILSSIYDVGVAMFS